MLELILAVIGIFAMVFVVGRFALALIAGVLFARAMSGNQKRRKRLRWTY